MTDHPYVVTMSNGDTGQADSLAGAMLAALTMHLDSDGEARVKGVKFGNNNTASIAATWACRQHLTEHGHR